MLNPHASLTACELSVYVFLNFDFFMIFFYQACKGGFLDTDKLFADRPLSRSFLRMWPHLVVLAHLE